MPLIHKQSSIDGVTDSVVALSGDVAQRLSKTATNSANTLIYAGILNRQSVSGSEAASTLVPQADFYKQNSLLAATYSQSEMALFYGTVLESFQATVATTWQVRPSQTVWRAAQRTVVAATGLSVTGTANNNVVLTSTGKYSVNRRAVNAFALNGS
jgi:hypothetical protein